MSDDAPTHAGTALVRRPAVPPMSLAPSLESADRHQFLHIDRHGKVRSPARYRAIGAGSYALTGTMLAVVTGLYAVTFGAGVGILAGGGLGVWYAWLFRHGRLLRRGANLFVHGRTDEARAIYERVLGARLVPRRMRALAQLNLGACAFHTGDYAEALELQHKALAYYQRRKRNPYRYMAEHAIIRTLVELDRVADARNRLDALAEAPPTGDYLVVGQWVAELYVCMAEGGHALGDDELHERARRALTITSASGLLGLCAWAHHVSGDDDLADHLLREALERQGDDVDQIEHGLPRLHAWMQERLSAASGTE